MIPKVRATFNRDLLLRQRQPGSYVDHEYIEGGFIDVPFKGDLQPMTPKELEQNPYGETINEGIKIYTSAPIDFKDTDIIPWNGRDYRIFAVTPRGGHKKIQAGILDA